MDNPRRYGSPPYEVVLVHGGPGAPGDMRPVAETLSHAAGVLEPLQTRYTVNGLVDELGSIINENAGRAVVLIGFSWGAWLSFITAARHPERIKKLILIGSGPFENRYAASVTDIRMGRLNEKEKERFAVLSRLVESGDTVSGDDNFYEFGALMIKADSYEPLSFNSDILEYRFDMFKKIWPEARELRRSGKLLSLADSISCPVTVIHGAHDPHPFEGVKIPLEKNITGITFYLLKKCGHKPWNEVHARDRFYRILESEIKNPA